MKKKTILLFVLSQMVLNINAQNITLNQYSNNLMHYFENKNNDIILETINVYKNGLKHDNLETTVMFFFYGIKIDNVERYNYFYNTVRQSGIQELINIFEVIQGNDIDNFLLNPEIHPELIDIYWTLYFSSGNELYLRKIIEIIERYNTSNDLMLYMSARGGIFTFKLNIRAYPTVLNYLNNNVNSELKSYILEKTFDEIEKDIMEYIRVQKENGNW
jgi:hypothetical protein